ncbi:MAG: GMC family oxidoreductase N-terminal domain-containing protein [Gemmatimonadota bacterium]|nr:GMC family oxidoreductase N-terminal domain-containing protein [Gemmatimonadota bacterium]
MSERRGPRLSAEQRATLDAVCRRIVPRAYESGDGALDVAPLVEARLARLEARVHADVARVLTLFGSALVAALVGGRARGMTAMTPEHQDEWLASWETSRLPLRRTAFQALRRLVLSTYYAAPAAHRALGYRGALFTRAPEVEWEGPALGVPRDDEPIARREMALRAPLQSVVDDERWREMNRVPPGVTQGRALPSASTIRAQVCVIGTGAGGAVAAARLAERGFDVVMVEEGGYYGGVDFSEDEAAMTPTLYADRGSRATDDLGVMMLQGRNVGGGTTVNWMVMLRTPGWVLDEWAREHGAEGMGPAEMSALFERVERETHTSVVPEDAHSPNNRVILDGARTLGWAASEGRINAKGCVRSGFCGLGCRYGAKQGALMTYVPRALAAGARLYSDVRADRIEVIERGGVSPLKRVRATVIDRATGVQRGEMSIEAPIIVLAGGAVGTPVLLQRSGLGGGAVGKFLRLHPTSCVIGMYDRQMHSASGIPLSAVCDEFLKGSDGYGLWIECPPMYPALASVALPAWGEAHRRIMDSYNQMGALIVLVRDGAERGVSNGSVRVDRSGRTRIAYRLSDTDGRHMRAGLAAAARLHLAAGAREARVLHQSATSLRSESELASIGALSLAPNRLSLFSAHVNGTCRLGRDTRTSGCTPAGERHGVHGLYVADGSLLPTALGVNPQETIMAMATVVAERIAESRAPG